MRKLAVVLGAFLLVGCAPLAFLLGKKSDDVSKEVDVNKDGKIDEAEWTASGYDLNKDGIPQVDEFAAAMAPHESTDWILQLLAALNVPFVGIATVALNGARRKKNELY